MCVSQPYKDDFFNIKCDLYHLLMRTKSNYLRILMKRNNFSLIETKVRNNTNNRV